MPALPKKNKRSPKKGWTAKPDTTGKKSVPPKKKLMLKERLRQKTDITKRSGRERRFITAKEIKIITRVSISQAYRVLKQIREKNGKPPHAPVTMQEFCNYSGLSMAEIQED